MNDEAGLWHRAKPVFQAALDQPPEERVRFVRETCGDDHALRREVESLLRADGAAGGFAARPAIHALAEPTSAAKGSHRAENALSAGTRLGPYEVIAHIGRGGMGEVYRARDTRLGRIVAIKVLPPHVASDAELKHRFEREARTLATLSHPHICAVFDVGHEAAAAGSDHAIDYLVMEHLDGETLAARIARGPLPLDEALQHAAQIAEALEAAHQMGVIHRDLKPGNIMLTAGGAKVLDFGLAKALGGDAPSPDLTQTPVGSVTREGWLLGTPAYMSPEQARGKPVDRRADLWAFGCVLFEMLTGKRTFSGDDLTETIAAVVREEPDWSTLPANTPPAIRRLLRRALVKDLRKRLADASTARLEIEEAQIGSEDAAGLQSKTPTGVGVAPAPRSRLGQPVPWILAAVLALAVAVLAVPAARYLRGPASAEPVRFLIDTPPLGGDPFQVTISPDGRTVAYVAQAEGARTTVLYVRPIGSVSARPLAGTEGAVSAFWSPDSRYIGFAVGFLPNSTLKKVEATGGPPQNVARCGSGTWNPNGVIICRNGQALSRVSASGGALTSITTLDTSLQETGHFDPQFLPDGRHFLYLAWSSKPENRAIYVGTLDSDRRTRLMAAESKAIYAPQGFLLFQRQATLFAQAFDATRLVLRGEPVPLAEGLLSGSNSGNRAFGVSSTETLVYRSGLSAVSQQLAWFDRQGRELERVGPAGPFQAFALSPDEKRVAFRRTEPDAQGSHIWTLEMSTGIASRLTTHPANEQEPVWSPDSQAVVFASNRTGNMSVFQRALGSREDVLVFASPEGSQWPDDWSSDGQFILINDRNVGIRALATSGDRNSIRLLLSDAAVVDEARFSPDGRWVAYASTESGLAEIYVASFKGGEFKDGKQVSLGGGNEPQWRRDGRELFYMTGVGQVMSVGVSITGSSLETTAPRKLFATRASAATFGENTYAVSADGERFLVLAPVQDSRPAPIMVVLNWTSLLK